MVKLPDRILKNSLFTMESAKIAQALTNLKFEVILKPSVQEIVLFFCCWRYPTKQEIVKNIEYTHSVLIRNGLIRKNSFWIFLRND